MPAIPKKKTALKKTNGAKASVATITKKSIANLRTSRANKLSIAPEEICDRVCQKAYEIFERRGFQHGFDQFDWDVAEKMVRLEVEVERDQLKSKKRINFDDQDLAQKIEQKAYELFQQKGCREGSAELDWYLAESIVRLQND